MLQNLEKDRYIIDARQIKEEQDKAYNESLKQDQEKERLKEEELCKDDLLKQERLQREQVKDICFVFYIAILYFLHAVTTSLTEKVEC